MVEQKKCISCGTPVIAVGGTVFECPGCSKKEIVRCTSCRKASVKYKCDCGFHGP